MSISGTGLDVRGIVSQLMQYERQPLYRLQSKQTALNTKKAVYTDLRAKLSTLRSESRALTDALTDPFTAKTVDSSATAVLTATAGSSATASQHSIFVDQLAQSHTMVSDQLTSSGTDIVSAVGAGTMEFTVTVDGEDVAVQVDVAADDTDEDVLANMVAAINDAFYDAELDHDVIASVVDDTTSTSKLVLRSEDTGSDYMMTLADTTGSLLSAIGIDNEAVAATDTTGGYIYAESALDAKFTLDGIDIVRNSNSVDDVLDDVTLNLLDAQDAEDSAVTLTISVDVASVKASVQGFLDDYNSALTYLRAKTAVSDGVRGDLADDISYRSLVLSIRTAVINQVTGADADDVSMLSEIGITAAADGTLSITDASDFEDAVAADPTAISNLFRDDDGVAQRVEDLLDPFLNANGLIDSSGSILGSQMSTLDEQIERMQDRMESREALLIKQYSKLNEVISSYQSQMSLIQQIQSLYSS